MATATKVITAPATVIENLQQSERATIAALRKRISPAEQVAKAIDEAVKSAAQVSLPQETAFALWQIRQNAIDILHSLSLGQILLPTTFPPDGSIPSPNLPQSQNILHKPSRRGPAHPNSIQTTYATIAKANTNPQRLSAPLPKQPGAADHPTPQQPRPTSNSDKRLFIRLSADSPFRALHPHVLKARARQALPATINITAVQNTASGLAISPTSAEDADKLAKAGDALINAFQATSAKQADP